MSRSSSNPEAKEENIQRLGVINAYAHSVINPDTKKPFASLGEYNNYISEKNKEYAKLGKLEWVEKFGCHFYYSDTKTGGVESWGPRETQEDAFAFVKFTSKGDGFELLQKGHMKIAHAEAIKEIDTIIDKEKIDSGSTFCTASICCGTVITANAGDSRAIRVTVNDKNQVTRFVSLNKLHNPDEPEERRRLEKENKDQFIFISDKSPPRLAGLAISRSIGDLSRKKYGLSNEPEIHIDKNRVSSKEKEFVIVMCDGLTEKLPKGSPQLDDETIKKIIENHLNRFTNETDLYLDTLAFTLEQTARGNSKYANEKSHCSQDNCTILITQMVPDAEQIIFSGVYDGHGGDKVAHLLREKYHLAFEKALEKQLQRVRTLHQDFLTELLEQASLSNSIKTTVKELLDNLTHAKDKKSSDAAKKACEEFMMHLYLTQYIQHRTKPKFPVLGLNLFPSIWDDTLSPYLENKINLLYADINDITLGQGLDPKSIMDRTLAYIGEHSPNILDFATNALKSFLESVKDESPLSDNNKKLFVNHFKLLIRLGEQGRKLAHSLLNGLDSNIEEKVSEKISEKNISRLAKHENIKLLINRLKLREEIKISFSR